MLTPEPIQMDLFEPRLTEGCEYTITESEEEALVPQPFDAVTEILPFCPDPPAVNVTELVVTLLPAKFHPFGIDQEYELAPETELTEYI